MESRLIAQANSELEEARREKERADLLIESVLQSATNALLFPTLSADSSLNDLNSRTIL